MLSFPPVHTPTSTIRQLHQHLTACGQNNVRRARHRVLRMCPLSRRRARAVLAILFVGATTLGSFLAPTDIHLASLLVAAPASTAAWAGPRLTTGVAFLAGVAVVAIDIHDGMLRARVGTPDAAWVMIPIHVVALILVSAFVIAFRALHDRDLKELTQVRAVSEAAQRVLLRRLPHRMGPLLVASAYRAAQAQAQIGGDVYAATRTARAPRLLIGDVRGKGLSAIGEAAALSGAFREAAYRNATLPELAASLEDSVGRHLAEIADTDDDTGERFITALIVEIPDDTGTVRMISCGHPPPLLSHRGRVAVLHAYRPGPPLGLAALSPDAYHVDTFPLDAGDTLVLYTDGVIEARDAAGDFYPASDRVATWKWGTPDQLLERILDDLHSHVGGRLDDDVAMVAVQRAPASGPDREAGPAGLQVHLEPGSIPAPARHPSPYRVGREGLG
ncbi:PP2C family protein-serine/threonine phosphatase [Streptomyces sp. NPDC059373]